MNYSLGRLNPYEVELYVDEYTENGDRKWDYTFSQRNPLYPSVYNPFLSLFSVDTLLTLYQEQEDKKEEKVNDEPMQIQDEHTIETNK